ncbi:MAG: hypothetical protein WKG00_17820 [Polyangiaceae bacterium]
MGDLQRFRSGRHRGTNIDADSNTVAITVEVPASRFTTVQAPPDPVSQLSADSVGLKRRAFLETLAPYEAAGGVVARRGKLRLVRREPFVAFLMASRPMPHPAIEQDADARLRAGAERFLASMGVELVAEGSR